MSINAKLESHYRDLETKIVDEISKKIDNQMTQDAINHGLLIAKLENMDKILSKTSQKLDKLDRIETKIDKISYNWILPKNCL